MRDHDKTTEVSENLTMFCREYGLNPGAMHKVLSGKRTHHKRFKVERL